MRRIDHLVIHCSATKAGQDWGAAEIRRVHKEQNGWRDIGYHYVIRRDGRVEPGRPVEEIGAHVSGHNAHSIGICLVGGIDDRGRPEANYTPAQWTALKQTLLGLRRKFPVAEICGHRDFAGVKKACPCFEVGAWLKKEGLA